MAHSEMPMDPHVFVSITPPVPGVINVSLSSTMSRGLLAPSLPRTLVKCVSVTDMQRLACLMLQLEQEFVSAVLTTLVECSVNSARISSTDPLGSL